MRPRGNEDDDEVRGAPFARKGGAWWCEERAVDETEVLRAWAPGRLGSRSRLAFRSSGKREVSVWRRRRAVLELLAVGGFAVDAVEAAEAAALVVVELAWAAAAAADSVVVSGLARGEGGQSLGRADGGMGGGTGAL